MADLLDENLTSTITACKRPRTDDSSKDDGKDDNDDKNSVESLLAIPLHVLFRVVPGSSRPWLTRNETQCLLHVNNLATELDVLVQTSEKALSQQLRDRQFSNQVERNAHNPFLRPLIPLLRCHTGLLQNGLLLIQKELDRILSEFHICATTLRQSAEQNWTLSESLLDAVYDSSDHHQHHHHLHHYSSSTQSLAQEKRMVAELEEEVVARMEQFLLVERTKTTATTKILVATAKDNAIFESNEDSSQSSNSIRKKLNTTDLQLLSMTRYCQNLLHSQQEPQSLMNETSASAPATKTHATTPIEQHDTRKDDHRNEPFLPPPPPRRKESPFYPSSFAPPKRRLPPRTQPDAPTQESDEDSRRDDDEHIPDPSPPSVVEESQNSYLKKTNAAEALAVLASGTSK